MLFLKKIVDHRKTDSNMNRNNNRSLNNEIIDQNQSNLKNVKKIESQRQKYMDSIERDEKSRSMKFLGELLIQLTNLVMTI